MRALAKGKVTNRFAFATPPRLPLGNEAWLRLAQVIKNNAQALFLILLRPKGVFKNKKSRKPGL